MVRACDEKREWKPHEKNCDSRAEATGCRRSGKVAADMGRRDTTIIISLSNWTKKILVVEISREDWSVFMFLTIPLEEIKSNLNFYI